LRTFIVANRMEKACKFWLIVPLTYVLTYHPSG
jgi:hypothetical protein